MIGLDQVPQVRDADAASRLPELAVLSEIEIAATAIDAIAQLPTDQAQLYLDAIMAALPAAARRILEDRMLRNYEYKSEFARKYYGQGREEGVRAAVVALVQAKLKTVSEAERAKLAAITDHRILTELNTAIGQARSQREARTALQRVLSQ